MERRSTTIANAKRKLEDGKNNPALTSDDDSFSKVLRSSAQFHSINKSRPKPHVLPSLCIIYGKKRSLFKEISATSNWEEKRYITVSSY